MPLVVMCGVPGSGKTTNAKAIQHELEKDGNTVELINEESLHIDKNTGYKDSLAEKDTRGKIKSAVQRKISKDVVVIADSLNYIKGFRYELYCVSRAANTTHCVVFCDTPEEKAKEWNQKNENKFDEQLLHELCMRMEVPQARARWDKPLFTIPYKSSNTNNNNNNETDNDKDNDKENDTQHLIKNIAKTAVSGKALRPTISTVPQRLSETNYMYELDKITNSIVSAYMKGQASASPGDSIDVPHSDKSAKFVGRVSIVKLKSIRTQFVRMSQMHPPSAKEDIGKLFVNYLNTSLENES